jgi:hypothetical protein
MTSDHLSRGLTTHLTSVQRELAPLVERGLITPEVSKALTVGVANYQGMLAVIAAPGAAAPPPRHFGTIDSTLAVRMPSVVGRARDVLCDLGQNWERAQKEFHVFRQRFMEVKLARARLVKAKQEIDAEVDEVDRNIKQAECDLEVARIEAAEADLARGEASMKGTLTRITEQSGRYAVVLKESGKEAFTEDDFLNDELDYLLRASWWHAAQTFTIADGRDDYQRRMQLPTEARQHLRADVKMEVRTHFLGLGISEAELEKELEALEGQRHAFNMMHRPPDRTSFTGHFEGWLMRAVDKYRERIRAEVARHGIDRLRKIATMITPTNDDAGGPGDAKVLNRRSTIR